MANNLTILSMLKANRASRRYLAWGVGLSVLEFVIFKILYPYPDFFSDSYSYIFAAYAHLNVSTWPIGYSKFLALFHTITASDTALVAFQYLMMQLATIYFFLTIKVLFPISKTTEAVLFGFVVLNPLALYLCNTINSDAIFCALSLVWITELIWVLYSPKLYHLLTQAVLIFICFTIRNNAYYYPILSAAVILFSSRRWWLKAIAAVLPVVIIVPFILWTRTAAFEMTGFKQYSFFTGWQLANNALYIYDKIQVDSTEFADKYAREINRYSQRFMDSNRTDSYRPDLEAYVGNYFIREPKSPLLVFFDRHYHPTNKLRMTQAWGHANALLEPFGKTIIINHPLAYLRYFVLPNIRNYLIPPLSHLGLYNYGKPDIQHIAATWFQYSDLEIHCVDPELQGKILNPYSTLFLLLNVVFLCCAGMYGLRKDVRQNIKPFLPLMLIITLYVITNFLFSIVATVNILRYEYIALILFLPTSLAFLDAVDLKATDWRKKRLSQAGIAKPQQKPIR